MEMTMPFVQDGADVDSALSFAVYYFFVVLLYALRGSKRIIVV